MWAPQFEKRHGHTEESRVKGYKDGKEAGASLL